jgi:hypothetical protein
LSGLTKFRSRDDGLVQRGVRPAIALLHEADRKGTGGKRPADDIGGAVRGTIVDDDELEIPVRLGEYALERPA